MAALAPVDRPPGGGTGWGSGVGPEVRDVVVVLVVVLVVLVGRSAARKLSWNKGASRLAVVMTCNEAVPCAVVTGTETKLKPASVPSVQSPARKEAEVAMD